MKSLKNYIAEAFKINKNLKLEENYLQKILELVKTYNLESIDVYNNSLLMRGGIQIDDITIDNIAFKDNKITCYYRDDENDEEGEFDCDASDWYYYFDEDITESVYKYLEKRLKEDK